jgi:DNA-directed RNA polymerase subunit RPC12/RpoP
MNKLTGNEIGCFECAVCGHEIEVNYSRLTFRQRHVTCSHCNAKFIVDSDAELINGQWYNKTKLVRV